MKVVLPWTDINPSTIDALASTGWQWESPYVGSSDTSYWQLLSRLWTGGESFVIVEQDIVVRPDTLDGFDECPSQWCGAPYPYFVGRYVGLGCMKFSADLLRQHPFVMAQVGQMYDDTHPPKHWCRLDGWLQIVLQMAQVPRCQLHEPVGHRDNGASLLPTHGCVKG